MREGRGGIVGIGGVQGIIRIELVRGIERVVGTEPIGSIDRVTRIETIGRVEGIVGRIDLCGVQRMGLSEAEAQRRMAARGPLARLPTSRSYASIIRANVLTVFNLILASLGALALVFDDWRDALFLGVLVSNSGIGIVQEVRAKRTLDRLAALVAPTATVVRDGRVRKVAVEALVVGDVVHLEAGDQVVADGFLTESQGLILDESILTGESQPVAHIAGEEIRAGSFAVEGTGRYHLTAVGLETWAQRLVGEARAFRHPHSPLERGLNRLLGLLVAVAVPLGALLVFTLWHRHVPLSDAVPAAIAGGVSLVPEGLMLLTSLTYAALRCGWHTTES